MDQLRGLCKKYLPDHEENMTYNMPSYVRNNQVEVAFASQKQHICVYFLIHEVMLNNADRLKGLHHGKGVLRFSQVTKIDYELVVHLLQETSASDQTIC